MVPLSILSSVLFNLGSLHLVSFFRSDYGIKPELGTITLCTYLIPWLLGISSTDSVWPKYLLSISAQIYKRANHVHSTLFYDWLMSSFGSNFHVCIWRLNSIDTRTKTFGIGFRCKYRCCQVPAGVVTGVEDPALNFGLMLSEVKPVSDFHFWPEIRVRQVWYLLR